MPEPHVIAPVGELDIASIPAFQRALSEAGAATSGDLVVDLSEVEFIDSSGLGAVLGANEQLRREGRTMTVVAPRGSAAALLLTLSNVRRQLTVCEARPAALNS